MSDLPSVSHDFEPENNRPLIADPEAPEPSAGNGSGYGQKVCKSCQTENAPDADGCVKCGKMLVGNSRAVKHRLYARHQPAEVIMNSDQLLAGLIADKGGADEMSTLSRSLAAKLRDTDILLALNKRTIITDGVDAPSGRKAHDRYLAALDRFVRIAGMLGLAREVKRVSSPLDYIAGRRISDGGVPHDPRRDDRAVRRVLPDADVAAVVSARGGGVRVDVRAEPEDEAFILRCLGRKELPREPATGLRLVIGRRGGKSRFASFLGGLPGVLP